RYVVCWYITCAQYQEMPDAHMAIVATKIGVSTFLCRRNMKAETSMITIANIPAMACRLNPLGNQEIKGAINKAPDGTMRSPLLVIHPLGKSVPCSHMDSASMLRTASSL